MIDGADEARLSSPLLFLLSVIEETFPLPSRFRSKLPSDVAELSRLLTSARGERGSGYLNRPNLLSAYLRYFLPWNVFRLCRIFSFSSGPSAGCGILPGGILPDLADGDAVTDLGSGPLTLPIALWLARPDLRKVKLEFRCVDKSAAILEAGHKLWKALCAASVASNRETAWKVKTIHASVNEHLRGKPAKLTAALNVFNEISAGIYQSGGIERNAHKAAAFLCKATAADGSIFVVEPGNPQGGAFIATLRAALLEKGRPPVAPCPHAGQCPFPGVDGRSAAKAKWCHFAFDTEAVPPALHKLSAAAGIPKERATFSFLVMGSGEWRMGSGEWGVGNGERGKESEQIAGKVNVRIISDVFSVSAGKANAGRYGCSERGMVLVTGNRPQLDAAVSGTLLELPVREQRDPKSGALVVPLEGDGSGLFDKYHSHSYTV